MKGVYIGFGGGEDASVVRARGGIGRREGLRILWSNPCRFDPCRAHHSRKHLRVCGDVVRNGELGLNRPKIAEYQALTHGNGLGTMSGFAGRVRFRSSKSDPHLRQCYQGLEQCFSETGQNHRRFGGVEPGTLFLAFLGRCIEIDRAVFGGDSLGGMALAMALKDACTPG